MNSNLLKKLKKKGVEVHIRSIFLQGALLKNQEELPKKIKNKESSDDDSWGELDK